MNDSDFAFNHQIDVGPELTADVAFRSDDDLLAIALQFVRRFNIQGGEGCIGEACVARLLVGAMEMQVRAPLCWRKYSCTHRTNRTDPRVRSRPHAHAHFCLTLQ